MSVFFFKISELVQKPGAILVEWSVNADDERGSDIQYFRLQRAYGDVLNDKHLVANFVDCFEGLDTQFLAKDIQPNQPYSFRVCCKYEGSTEWSPWSLAKVAFTELKHFSWRFSQDYIVTNENKIARCTKSYPEVLFSEGPQFLIGHSIDFIVSILRISITNLLNKFVAVFRSRQNRWNYWTTHRRCLHFSESLKIYYRWFIFHSKVRQYIC